MGNMSAAELARRTGLLQQTVHRLLSGATPDPRVSTLKPIARYFNIRLDQLLGDEALPQPKQHDSVDELVKLTKEKNFLRERNQKLFCATKSSNLKQVASCIATGADLHLCDGLALRPFNTEENNLLHIAVQQGDLALVKLLVENGAKLTPRNRKQQTPLHLAVHHNRLNIMHYLLANNANKEARENDGATPLSWAAYFGNMTAAKLLIKFGAMIDAKDNEDATPLHWACYTGQTAMVRYLITRGASLSSKNAKGDTPMQCAIDNGHLSTVEYLATRALLARKKR